MENAGRYRLVCPNCGNNHLQAITETTNSVQTTTSGGGYSGTKGCLGLLLFGPFGLLCGNCGQSQTTTSTAQTTTKTYWICQDCGNKFRDLKELQTDMQKAQQQWNGSQTTFYKVFIGIILGLAFLALYGLFGFMTENEGLGFLISSMLTAWFIWACYVGQPANYKANYERLKKEYEELEARCKVWD